MCLQTGLANSTREAVSTIYEKEGPGGLYNGLTSNIAYAFPTDAIKFLVRIGAQQMMRSRVLHHCIRLRFIILAAELTYMRE